jgi:hypothetical protein
MNNKKFMDKVAIPMTTIAITMCLFVAMVDYSFQIVKVLEQETIYQPNPASDH